MDKKKLTGKKRTAPGAIGVLLAGTALAVGGTVSTEGSAIQNYIGRAKPGYCTVLVYMVGSDLESDYGAASADLKEMEEAVAKADPEGEKIHVVVEAGGAVQWQYEPMQGHRYGRFCITGSGVSEVEGMETRDMGRADTLADFINYGTQSYRAQHYGLIFWNHGAGQIQGFGDDENYDGSSLSLEEIKDGIERSSCEDAFDFIGMDACLMGNIELAAALQGKTDYLIASEELEPQDGFAYEWMEVLGDVEPDEEYGRKAGNAILSSYENFYQGQGAAFTLTLVDLGKYDAFYGSFEEIVNDLSLQTADSGDRLYRQLGKTRSRIQGFGQRDYGHISEQVDIMSLFGKLAEEGVYAGRLYRTLNEAYGKLAAGKVWGGYAEEPGGISIYLPGGDNERIRKDCRVYSGIPFCEEYQDFVNEYADYLMQEKGMSFDVPMQEETEIRMKISSEQVYEIADAYSTVFLREDDCSYMLMADGDVVLDLAGYLKTPLENVFWGLKGQILCLIEKYSTDYITEYTAPVLYRKGGGEWIECMVNIAFWEECPDGEITSVVPCGILKQEYVLEEGDELIPLYPVYEPEDVDAAKDVPAKGGRIYKNEYYMGEAAAIEDMETGDGDLEKITLKDKDRLQYGFLIRDTKMELYYTDFAVE